MARIKRAQVARFGGITAVLLGLVSSPCFSQNAETPSAAYEHWRLVHAGLQPLAERAISGSDIQRIGGSVYLLSWPSVEVERNPAGVTTFTMHFLGNSVSKQGPNVSWDRLKARLERALVPSSKRELAKAEKKLRHVACHGIEATLETSLNGIQRRQRFFTCFGKIAEPGLAYANAIADEMLRALPECRSLSGGADSYSKLLDCVGLLGWKITPQYRELEEATPFPSKP